MRHCLDLSQQVCLLALLCLVVGGRPAAAQEVETVKVQAIAAVEAAEAIETVKASVAQPPFPYDETLAGYLGSLAEVAYCGPLDKARNWTCEPCLDSGLQIVPGTVRQIEKQEFGQKGAVFVYVARFAAPAALSGSCVVSVRGTEKISNWIRDAEFWSATLPIGWCEGCRVMSGFWKAWNNVESMVLAALTEIGCGVGGGGEVHVTGHSLGAAMGTLATWSMLQQGYKVGSSYVFASPRVGDAAFAAAFSAAVGRAVPFFRISYGRDAVVHLPPVAAGYVHVASEVFYDVGQPARLCEGPEDPLCANQYSLYYFSDHCRSAIVPSKDLCECPGWVGAGPALLPPEPLRIEPVVV